MFFPLRDLRFLPLSRLNEADSLGLEEENSGMKCAGVRMKHGRGLKQDRKLKREEQGEEETTILTKSSNILMAWGSGVAAM